MRDDWRGRIDLALVDDHIRWRVHATDRMHERGLAVHDVLVLLRASDVIEQDDDRRAFPTAVLLGRVGVRLLHVVVGWQAGGCVLACSM